jgi:hypothetical protein
MPYQSCKYGPPPPEGMEWAYPPQMIICTDENGVEWQVPPDCQVGDWLRYTADGGEIAPYEPPEPEEPA